VYCSRVQFNFTNTNSTTNMVDLVSYCYIESNKYSNAASRAVHISGQYLIYCSNLSSQHQHNNKHGGSGVGVVRHIPTIKFILYCYTTDIASGVLGHISGPFLCFLILPLLAFSVNQLLYIGMKARIWFIPRKLMKNLKQMRRLS
jgi:hypothetical protein